MERTRPLSVTTLLHIRMRVNDIERTVSFYKDVLGLSEGRRIVSPRGSKIVYLTIPGSDTQIEVTEFHESGPVSVPPDLVHLAFEIPDMNEALERLTRLGVPVTDGPTETSGSVFAFIDAPEGYEIELIAPKSRG
jgi:lactoylglutathione lyase|uniref:Putative glyoxalase (GloA) n=1 Tax=Leptospirillum ferrodiazotrophum TaxID=412449 RepID=C6HXX5_9BACT|nr:MAG: putative glyoxalase (GloA) [Leptospirillum ferrodiazotrophum]